MVTQMMQVALVISIYRQAGGINASGQAAKYPQWTAW